MLMSRKIGKSHELELCYVCVCGVCIVFNKSVQKSAAFVLAAGEYSEFFLVETNFENLF